MSWLELDDGILDHPKFIRAIKQGGSEVVHLWLGLRSYCGKLLTDGEIPVDMLDEIRGPTSKKRCVIALKALIDANLIEEKSDGSLVMHDYLQWSSSRQEVLQRRESSRLRQQRNRHTDGDVRTLSRRDSQETSALVTLPRARLPSDPLPHHTDPLPHLSESERSPAELPSDPDPLKVAGLILLVKVAVGDRRPDLGLYQPGHWAHSSAERFLDAIPPDKRTDATRDEIRAKIAVFAACEDARITKGTWSVQAFCDGYNALATAPQAQPAPRLTSAQAGAKRMNDAILERHRLQAERLREQAPKDPA
jgi:hypothetical protein